MRTTKRCLWPPGTSLPTSRAGFKLPADRQVGTRQKTTDSQVRLQFTGQIISTSPCPTPISCKTGSQVLRGLVSKAKYDNRREALPLTLEHSVNIHHYVMCKKGCLICTTSQECLRFKQNCFLPTFHHIQP